MLYMFANYRVHQYRIGYDIFYCFLWASSDFCDKSHSSHPVASDLSYTIPKLCIIRILKTQVMATKSVINDSTLFCVDFGVMLTPF
jgi:hypothetical protein